MELENELKKLRWAEPSPGLRSRILRDARADRSRPALIPPWWAAIERHWLFPGRAPVTALLVAWLVIASLHFTTPASLVPMGGPARHLSDEEIARLQVEHAQLLAELRRAENDLFTDPTTTGTIPPRS